MWRRRSILLAGAFSALLLVLAVSAFAVWRSARSTQDRVTTLHATQMQADDVLDAIRDNVYLQGLLTRDYLLDSDPAQAPKYRAKFDELRARMEQNFQRLEAAGEAGVQLSAVSQLRREFEAYSDITHAAFGWTEQEKRLQGLKILSERLHRRQEILAIAGQIEQIITRNFERQGEEINRAGDDFRISFAWTIAIALILGFSIAGITLARMSDLEQQSHSAESELRRLTGQLRSAQEQERRYLSRELHDQVGQLLTGLRMELSGMARTREEAHAEFGLRVTRAKGTVEELLRIVRDIAMLLRPPMLDDLGLTPALTWLVREVSRSSGMKIETEIDPAADDLPDAHRTCLYRVVQEALTNASRHSGAHNVQVVLRIEGLLVAAAITDDGRGFGTDSGEQKSLGLLGMEERARELGGTLRVGSYPGRGTRVEMELPRPRNPNAPEVMDAANSDCGRPRNRSDGFKASA